VLLLLLSHTLQAGSSQSVTYKLKWCIATDQVDNVRGVERTYRISIEYRKPVQVGGQGAPVSHHILLSPQRLPRMGPDVCM
jgi:hypothetical protein